jgi:hypothetical protein
MLLGDEDVINSDWDNILTLLLVLHSDLNLGIRVLETSLKKWI